MASFVEYRENAAECARLALVAPSQMGRASFDAAAKHWMMLYRLTAESETAESSGVNERSFFAHRSRHQNAAICVAPTTV